MTGTAWVVIGDGVGSRVLSFSSQGEPLGEMPFKAQSIVHSASDGKLWLASENMIIALDRQGRVVTAIAWKQGGLAYPFAP